MKTVIGTVIMMLLLAGCTAGPDYRPPETVIPPRFVLQNVLETLSESSATVPANWWHGFEDEMLDNLVEQGLNQSFILKSAAARVSEARATINLAETGNALTVGVQAGTDIETQLELDDNNTESDTNQFAIVGAVLPLDIAGRTRRRVDAAQAGYAFAVADLRGIVLGLSADIASEYLLLRGNQRQLELLKESVALQEETLAIVRIRFETGLAPDLDLQRAITTVENLRSRIPSLEESLLNSTFKLATLTGQFPGTSPILRTDKAVIPRYNGRIPAVLPASTLLSRPDVQQAEANLKAAIARIGIAEAEFYPLLQLGSTINLTANGISSASSETLFLSLGSLIEQTLLDGGRRDANMAIANAQTNSALADYQQTLREAMQGVETTLAAITTSQQRQTALQKAVTASARSFKQAEILYQQGLISFLDVVDAQRVLADARQSLAQEKTNFATRIARLFAVLGTNVTMPDISLGTSA